MRGQEKKREDEMLIVHRPPEPQELAGREPSGPEAGMLPPARVEDLVARVMSTADPRARARLVQSIQASFGNAIAERVVGTVREREVAPKPPGGRPTEAEGE